MINMKKKTLFALIAAVLALCVLLAGCGSDDTPGSSKGPDGGGKEVSSIEVSKTPDKTEYMAGEEFSVAGGEITVTYSDGTTETKSLTDSEVTISDVSISVNDASATSEKKTVTVRFGGKSARFDITVNQVLYTVAIDYGDGRTDSLTVREGDKVERPADPARDGFNFDNWYSDSSLTTVFDFDAPVAGNCTVYAKWLEDAVYYDVTFSNNYAGAVTTTPQKVKEGDKAICPTTDPARKGYAFDGWYTTVDGGAPFDFDAAITSDVTIYAKWTRTVSGRNTYIFEAEDSNLNGKTGPGLSGTAGGPGMIQTATNLDASNDRFVGYQYDMGCSLQFQFNSDMEVHDATIIIRLSAELRDFDIDPSSYVMTLNGVDLDYGTISFTNVPKGSSDSTATVMALPFKDYVVVRNATLVEGMNVFSVTTMNEEGMSGTTMVAKAPLIDCIKVETEAVLDWAAQLGLPKKNY